jgi:hypothetical protein
VHISSTTLGIDTAQKLPAVHRKHGRIYVAGTRCRHGSEWQAVLDRSGRFRRSRPLRSAIRRSRPALAINFLNFSTIEAMGEAFALAAQYGVQPSDFYEFITSTLFGSPP